MDTAAIGVSVRDAVVTLSGKLTSFAQKHAAGEVVAAIRGVRGVANELELKLPIDTERMMRTSHIRSRRSLYGTVLFLESD